MMKGLTRILEPIKRRIQLMVGRAIIKTLTNGEGTQKLQVMLLPGEVREMEKLGAYGFESSPLEGAEGVCLFMGGLREHGIVILTHDRRYRPQDLERGESAMYTDEDTETDKHRVHLKRGQEIEILGKILNAVLNGSVTIDAQGAILIQGQSTATIQASGNVLMQSTDGDLEIKSTKATGTVKVTSSGGITSDAVGNTLIKSGGNVTVQPTGYASLNCADVRLGSGAATPLMLNTIVNKYNNHQHTYVYPAPLYVGGSGGTTGPVPAGVLFAASDYTTKVDAI